MNTIKHVILCKSRCFNAIHLFHFFCFYLQKEGFYQNKICASKDFIKYLLVT